MPTNLELAPPLADVEGASDANPIRVVLADDHDAMRRSLRRLLDAEAGITVMAEAFDLETAARHVQGHSPHVLILDLHLPNGSAVGMVRELRRQAPGTQIVVLTMEISPAFAKQALDACALGYGFKEHADRDLTAAVRAAVRGERYVTPEVAVELEAMRTAAEGERLTDREIEVLRLTALGHTAVQTAEKLHVSRRTRRSAPGQSAPKLGLDTQQRWSAMRYDATSSQLRSSAAQVRAESSPARCFRPSWTRSSVSHLTGKPAHPSPRGQNRTFGLRVEALAIVTDLYGDLLA